MLTVLAALALSPIFAQTPEAAIEEPIASPSSSASALPDQPYAEVIRHHQVRPLPGQLDEIPVFNSNSPELIQKEGILLSTFPTEGMSHASAHLDYAFEGRFDIFAHHIARGVTPNDRRTLFLGILLYNPAEEPVTVNIQQAVSYLSQEAPFRDLPTTILNPNGTIYAGPGSRTTTDFLRGASQAHWPSEITIPAGHVHLLANTPIPLRQLTVPSDGSYPQGSLIPKPPPSAPSITAAQTAVDEGNGVTPVATALPRSRALPSNGRTAMMYLDSDGPVHVASLAMYAPRATGGAERVPTLREWIDLLKRADLAGPRDKPPTDPDNYRFGRFYYGRVAGVAQGSSWNATLTDTDDDSRLTIPSPGDSLSYVISTVDRNTFGTGQIQSAPMLVRYPDTAYRAHGNYGIHYSLRLPLYNPTGSSQTVLVKLQTPLQDESLTEGLRFRTPPDNRVFFRGSVRLRYRTPIGVWQTHYVHVVQRRGEEGDPLVRLPVPGDAYQELEVDIIYPPDATPPQVLTVETVDDFGIIEANENNHPQDDTAIPTTSPVPTLSRDNPEAPAEVSN